MASVAITIGRQFGSGGFEIGKRVSEELGIPFYDKELVELAAKKSNMHNETLEKIDEKATGSFLYSIAMGNYSLSTMGGPLYYDMPINDKLFLAQSDVIKEKAMEGSCVFVGRCADYVLSGADFNVASIFIYAPLEHRIQNVMEQYGLTASKAKEKVVKTEKQRRAYYDYYTNREWSSMLNYDLCLDAAALGIDCSVDLIKLYAKSKMDR